VNLINGNTITNEVGGLADVLAPVMVVNFASESELEAIAA